MKPVRIEHIVKGAPKIIFKCDLDFIAFMCVVGVLGYKMLDEYYISRWGKDHGEVIAEEKETDKSEE